MKRNTLVIGEELGLAAMSGVAPRVLVSEGGIDQPPERVTININKGVTMKEYTQTGSHGRTVKRALLLNVRVVGNWRTYALRVTIKEAAHILHFRSKVVFNGAPTFTIHLLPVGKLTWAES